MEIADYLFAAVPALGFGLAAAWWMRRRPEAAHVPEPPAPLQIARNWPAAALPVLVGDKVIEATGTTAALEEVRLASGLTEPTWRTHVVPTIRSVAEMTQQLPASEAHHHAQPGGLWIHTVETLQHAARLRQGRILPPGADIEAQGRIQHIWTVGIYIAALLHDVGKTVADLRVTLFSAASPSGATWKALMGSMNDAKAEAYVVDFPRALERDYQAHQKIGIQLVQRLVPTETRIWLSTDQALLDSLMGYLGGDLQGPIAEIVREAEAESVRRNLAAGTRVRFATSRATPLIELLMHALRSMLAEGGRLPLNRPGAAGFCDGADVWFAAARLANEVRDWLKKAYPEEPVPGETMNDRLFDTWQEYGACKPNPDTQGAIWSARIEFAGAQAIRLGALLRFPLELLYPAPSLYPPCLDGRIICDAIGAATGAADTQAEASPVPEAANGEEPPVTATPAPAPAAPTPQDGPATAATTGPGPATPIPDNNLAQPAPAPTPRLPNIQGLTTKARKPPPLAQTSQATQAAPAPIQPPELMPRPIIGMRNTWMNSTPHSPWSWAGALPGRPRAPAPLGRRGAPCRPPEGATLPRRQEDRQEGHRAHGRGTELHGLGPAGAG
ncbi:MobH family relaxase [Parasulfuritortus cantonensis]|nr:MobH family relaxase [Parasulfuritortus cantonensis]